MLHLLRMADPTGRRARCPALALLLLLTLAPLAAREPDVQTASGRHFEAVAIDLASARTAVRLGDALAERTAEWLPVPASFPRPVLVQLVPPGHPAAPARSRIFIGQQSQVTLAVRWTTATTEGDLLAALGQALLTRLALWHGAEAARPVPVWLEALAWTHFRAAEQPALREVWAARYAALPQPDLNRLLDPLAPALDEAVLAHQAWLLGELIERSLRSRSLRQDLFRRLLVGEPGPLRLRQALGIADDEALAAWWRGEAPDLARHLGGAVETVEQSRRRIEGLLLVAIRSPEAATGWSTWPDLADGGWGDAALRRLAAERLSAVKRAFIRINPLYHNALHALGELLEARVEADRDALEAALAAWEADWPTARSDASALRGAG